MALSRVHAHEGDAQSRPWVLIRRGVRGVIRCATREEAQRIHDMKRRNLGNAGCSATVRGPGGEAWHCGPFRHDKWVRDDNRHSSVPASDEVGA